MIRSIVSLVTAFALTAVHGQLAQELGENGKLHIQVPQKAGYYGILSHSRNLQDWQPVNIALLDTAGSSMSDSVPPRLGGFYQIEYVPLSTPLDTDGDGRNDLIELSDSGYGGVALNAAMNIAEDDGTIHLPSQEIFDQLSKRDNFPGAQNVKEVKFLITDINTNPQLYFFDVSKHQFHLNFARDVLGRYTGVDINTANRIFSSETYFSNANRKNLAGSLVAHENYVSPDGSRGLYTLEFWPTDPVPFPRIELAYEMVARSAPFIDRLFYHAPSETQRRIQREAAAEFAQSFVHTIQTDELFGNVEYQAMHQREAFGRLKSSTGSGTLSARDIVIFKTLPNDLTKVAGIITEVPQTPLSHVNLKAQQNDTPNAFIANAATHPDIQPFLGENVFYAVRPEGFEIRLATQQEVDDFFENSRPSQTSFPARNLTRTEIKPLSAVSFTQSDSFGGKATNVAELLRLFPENTPDGFAIPYYFYDAYMMHNNFYAEAQQMIADSIFQSEPNIRSARLKAFRKRIKKDGEFPAWMIEALTTLQNSFPAEVTPRLRSSANAEDSLSFNGAGLYDSFTHKADEGFIGKSVRQVWASLWNYRAYEEREFYRIDHLTSAMGILVHPNESNEQANGVAVARNIFDPRWEGYYINSQAGEDLVTNPDAESIPEELLAADLLGEEDYEIQYIRFSNKVPEGTTVLTKAQVLDLVTKMKRINSRFRSLYLDFNLAMEIEFKITEDGKLSVKQARPYVN